jgi:hypothetical protein
MTPSGGSGGTGRAKRSTGKSGTGPFRFDAKLVKKDVFFGVEVPAAVSKAIGRKGFVPILGTAGGAPIRTTLSPSGGGRHHVLLNRDVREAAGVVVGALVTMVLRVDLEPPVDDVAEDLADALRDEGVLEDFMRVARGRRNQLLRWMESAVQEETRAKRIVRLVEIAHAEREKRIDRQGSR